MTVPRDRGGERRDRLVDPVPAPFAGHGTGTDPGCHQASPGGTGAVGRATLTPDTSPTPASRSGLQLDVPVGGPDRFPVPQPDQAPELQQGAHVL